MKIKNSTISNYLLWIIFSLTFLGFYAILLLVFNVGKSELSRQLTIPMRLLIGASCGLLLIINIKNKSPHLKWFLPWVFIYILRIFIDYNNNEDFYISFSELMFFFASFVVIPFIGLSKVNYSKINFKKLYNVILISALAFTSLSILLYGRFLGQVGRLSASTAKEAVISPLILSYCGALAIGVISFYLLYAKKTKKYIKLLSLVTLALAVIPFFLGASRGSIFALFLPFVMMVISNLSFKNILKYIFLFTIIIFLLGYLDEYLGSGLLNRFMGTSEAIEQGGSSASRLDIWNKSLSQFTDFPFFGDRLNTVDVDYYPHNIYIEVLQATGIIGFVPFIVLFFKGMKASFNIFKRHAEYAWIPVFFLQATMQNTFSGAVYTAAWFWTSLAVVISLNYSLKIKYKYENF